MRYSEIVGSNFYYIKLTKLQAQLVDAHYLAAAHHRARYLESGFRVNTGASEFHFGLFGEHVLALLRTVAAGDFSVAKDPLGHGLDRSDEWYKERFEDVVQKSLRWGDIRVIEQDVLPDAGMFDGFPADRRFTVGEPHDYDFVLDEPNLVSKITAALFMVEVRLAG